MAALEKIFGTHSSNELRLIEPTVKEIESLRDKMKSLSAADLQAKTSEFKERLAEGASLDAILPEAFAAIREAAARVINMEAYRVQLIGGIILHQGRVAEMRTGEGKTLVAIFPAYLNALEGKGSIVVTVNDYLAERDAELMRPAYEFMGMSVGVVLNGMTTEERQAAYASDITYVTNNELGFDYLRDNLAKRADRRVLRGLHYAIIDEADSVLIDEARTPLIISEEGGVDTGLLKMTDLFVKSLERGNDILKAPSKLDFIADELEDETGDYAVCEKDKYVTLTASGITKAETVFSVENLTDIEHLPLVSAITLSLKANTLFKKDRDYIVKDGEVLIVDEFTGRILPGRRYSEGLHQAIEAKEGVEIQKENLTAASITFQSFFNKFKKKAGMTGTALTEEQEFRDIYSMDVIVIPTNRPVQREDLPDVIYRTKESKHKAVIQEIIKAHATGQPVLVGTVDIATNELLGRMLAEEGVPHRILNAKYDAEEAEIVSHAGEAGAVTIATNMAGRGTDIKLDDAARAAGGLYIIGTQRHESRRIDNQLRGRAGRQGDPGKSKFFISLEDDLLRLFGSDKILKAYEGTADDGKPLKAALLAKVVTMAQENVESTGFQARKSLLDYDEVLDRQRTKVYEERDRILDGAPIHEEIKGMVRSFVDGMFEDAPLEDDPEPIKTLCGMVSDTLGFEYDTIPETLDGIKDIAVAKLDEKAEAVGDAFPQYERYFLLQVVDNEWKKELSELDTLRTNINSVAIGRQDPKVEYSLRASRMFNEMNRTIREKTVKMLFSIRVEYEYVQEDDNIRIDTGRAAHETLNLTVGKKKKVSHDDIADHE